MSGKSKSSLKGRNAIDRPFDETLWKRAEKIVVGYRVVLEESRELGFMGTSIELPTVFADGKTANQCVLATRDALSVAVASMLERGLRPPISRERRSIQINVRLTADEKLALEEAASRLGYKGVSEYVRAAALDRSHAA